MFRIKVPIADFCEGLILVRLTIAVLSSMSNYKCARIALKIAFSSAKMLVNLV